MLGLPPFAYASPKTVEEASEMLASSQSAVLVSGGTDLYPNIKRRQAEPRLLVSLSGIAALRGIRGDGDRGLTIGALSTLEEVATSPLVTGQYPVLAEAAMSVGSPQIRNGATLGGNLCQDTRCSYYDMPLGWRKGVGYCLKKGGDVCRIAPGSDRCWAVSSSDIAPVAMALNASVSLVSTRGERLMGVKSLYRNDGVSRLSMARDEILTELKIPPSGGLKAKYLKLRQRGTIDFPLLGVAVAVRLDEQGVCTLARVVLGAVGSSPVEAEASEEILTGGKLTDEKVKQASTEASRLARPMDNTGLTLQYRKTMVQVYVARALKALAA